jgi:hypothetical protein
MAGAGLTRLDAAIERAFAFAADRAEPSQAAARLRIFERILLLHLSVRFATGTYPEELAGPTLHAVVVATVCGCLALSFVERFAPLAVAGAFCALLALLARTFPATGNHFFLELWGLALLLFVGRRTTDESELLQAALRWSIAIVLFYTGVQKVLYGTYFDAQYLSFEIALKPEFEQVFAPLLPAAELTRLQEIVPGQVGSGPYRSEAPLLLLAANVVYLFELITPFLLFWPRTRKLAVAAVVLFTIAIQSGAREVYFGGLLVNWTLLFWPRGLVVLK